VFERIELNGDFDGKNDFFYFFPRSKGKDKQRAIGRRVKGKGVRKEIKER
jgi:hypothetical protein